MDDIISSTLLQIIKNIEKLEEQTLRTNKKIENSIKNNFIKPIENARKVSKNLASDIEKSMKAIEDSYKNNLKQLKKWSDKTVQSYNKVSNTSNLSKSNDKTKDKDKFADTKVGKFYTNAIKAPADIFTSAQGDYETWTKIMKGFKKSEKTAEKATIGFGSAQKKIVKITMANSNAHKLAEKATKDSSLAQKFAQKETNSNSKAQNVAKKATNSNAGAQKTAEKATKRNASGQKMAGRETKQSTGFLYKNKNELKSAGIQTNKVTGYLKNHKKITREYTVVQKAASKQVKNNTNLCKSSGKITRQLNTVYTLSQGATEGLEVAQMGLNGAFKANPVGFVIESIIVLISLFQLAYDNIKPVRDAVDALVKVAVNAAKALGNLFGIGKKSSSGSGKSASNNQSSKSAGGTVASTAPKKVKANAKGTNSWQGGPTLVHEKGGEIMDLPKGTRIYPHDKSLQMAKAEGAKANAGSSISINISKLADKLEVRSDRDIDAIANKLADKLEKIMNNTGKVAYA